jgi:hypothetical protein
MNFINQFDICIHNTKIVIYVILNVDYTMLSCNMKKRLPLVSWLD